MNNKMKLIIFWVLLTQLSHCTKTEVTTNIQNGSYKIPQSFDVEKNVIELNGKWKFTPNKLIKSDRDISDKKIILVDVPQKWNIEEFKVKGYLACGTYLLDILVPPKFKDIGWSLRIDHIRTNYKIFNNGKLLQKLGNVSCDAKTSVSKVEQDVIEITPVNGKIKLAIQVSNFHYRETGITKSIHLGKSRNIKLMHRGKMLIDLSIFGLVIIMGLYHIGLFFNRREDLGSMYFGLYCLLAGIRILVTNTLFVTVAFPNLSYWSILIIEYISFYYLVPVFLGYLIAIFEFKKKIHHYLLRAHLIFATIFSIHNLFSNSTEASILVLYYNINLAVTLVHVVYLWVKAAKEKRDGSVESIVGGFILLFFVSLDMMVTFHILPIPYTFSMGFALFIFAQSFTISKIFALTYSSIKKLSKILTTTNTAYAKFVPTEFLGLLGKKDITEIHLGDQVGKEMTILFSDIRSFTTLSESMTPKENFNFINSYLKRMGPIVTRNHGFIDKYIGDAIMALFPGKADDAVNAAIEMQLELKIYNQHRAKQNYIPIATGIGIHTGGLMLGTIGVENRMDGTVVSDAVNLSSRIESLTKKYGVPILVSEATLTKLADPNKYDLRKLDRVKVKGKTKEITVYEVFNALEEKVRQEQSNTLEEFEAGVSLYLSGNFEKALTKFEAVYMKNTNDKAAMMYVTKCRNLIV